MMIINSIISVVYGIVNQLLLVGNARILRLQIKLFRCCLGAFIGSIYVLICLQSNSAIISSLPVYLLSLLLMAIIAYGIGVQKILCIILFVVLNLTLGGINVGTKGLLSLLFGTISIILIGFIARNSTNNDYVKVEIQYNGKTYCITALKDTGNSLKDPLTGESVLIIGADAAEQITGLSVFDLQNPIDTIEKIPGLRLISYNTINQAGALMLAMRMKNIKIGSWQGSSLVAFSPCLLCTMGKYQALLGG